MSEPNVITEVVAKSLCCGCGVCGGVCPSGVLEMKFNPRGELVPTLTGICAECQLCLKVCPALELGEPLSREEVFAPAATTRQDRHVGHFIESYVGYSPRHRDRAASGGMATLTLEELFRQDKIDAAVCVGSSEKKDRLFEAVIVSSEADVLSCSSSKYYPVEFSSALTHIMENEGRYAIVALPCAVTAIRKAQRAVPVLRERICYVFGLACGHVVSRHFTNFLLGVAGLEEGETEDVDFRYTGRSPVANDYAFRARRPNGTWSRPLFLRGLCGRLWAGRFFVPRACDFCDDLFAPLADATFMDAWLPECVNDPRGTSIVVVRHPEVTELLERATDRGTCHLRPIEIERVRQSQSGALAYKTVYLPLRVARAERDGLRIPRSFPRALLHGGLKEKLARTKHTARDRVCLWTFDSQGRPRHFWVSVLSGYLRAQSLWRAIRRFPNRLRNRMVKSGQTRGKR